MPGVCPLIFEPILKPKIWGGRKLAKLFNKPFPTAVKIGESWECADLPGEQSIVARGPAKGRALHELVEAWGADLCGRTPLSDGRFPLLIKFLDASEPLSIQVHPHRDDPAAGATTKHEAWYVLAADPDAVIYRGLRAGVGSNDVRRCLASDPSAIVKLLNAHTVRPGDCFYLPGGTIHAIGAGVALVEVQTPSTQTYRLYDWGRIRPGDDAGLHVEQALACLQVDPDFNSFENRSHVSSLFTTVTRLISSPNLQIEKVRFVGQLEQEIPYAEMVCWVVLQGTGEILYGEAGRERFGQGDVLLLPAALEKGRLSTREESVVLEVTVPVASDLSAYDRPSATELRAPDPAAPISLNIDAPRGRRDKPE